MLADVADSNDDNNDNNDDEDRASCDVNGSNGVMSSPSCLNNKLVLLMCLNDDKLNVFDVDDILVKSIVSMLVVDDANEGGKDKNDNDDDSQQQRRRAFVALNDGAKCDVVDGLDERRVVSGLCPRSRCLLTDSVKILFLLNSSLNMNMLQLSCGAVDYIDL
jgi:hypothetical protein